MFRHVILFQFKTDATDVAIEEMFQKIGALQKVIPDILDYSWGENQWLDKEGFTHGFVMSFGSKESRDTYQNHEAHQLVVNEFVIPLMERASVFDYVCGEKRR